MSNAYNQIPHPGLILKEKLQELDMSVKEFSIRADKTEQQVLEIIGGNTAISADMAVAVEYVTGMAASVLLNWQRQYDEAVSRQKIASIETSKTDNWINTLPVKEMLEYGWITPQQNNADMASELLRFFGVVSPEAWENYYFKQRLRVAFRISLGTTVNPNALSAWLRRGEIQAQQMYIDNAFSVKYLKDSIEEIAFMLIHPEDDVLDSLQDFLASRGVKMLYTEPLDGVPIKGATRWIHGYPCIQLLKKTDAYDNFTYTVLHEIGHIVLHGKKDIFLEEAGFVSDDNDYNQKEQEADAFARKLLEQQN